MKHVSKMTSWITLTRHDTTGTQIIAFIYLINVQFEYIAHGVFDIALNFAFTGHIHA